MSTGRNQVASVPVAVHHGAHTGHHEEPDTSRPPTGIEPVLPLPYPIERRTVPRARLCVVLPAFNEAEALPLTYAALREMLDTLDVGWRILFVNDGSGDNSAAVLHGLHRADDRVGYLLLARNFGHQAALTAGLDHADGDAVITMDADLQHPPSIIGDMLAAWREGYDVVHTRKLVTEGLSPAREVTTRMAYRLIQRVSRVMIIPHASDFRLMDRSVVEAMRGLPETNRLYRGLTPWLGFRQCVLPIMAAKRAAGHSQYGLRQLLSLFSKAFFDFSSAPLHLGLFLGGAAVGLSVLYLIFILAWIVFGTHTPPGWASTVSVTLLLNSISLAFSGIIGVYVARIYDQVRARPPYVVSHAFSPRPIDAE
jgi:glycosyltransferase involved in cell wall biosynthesis